MRQVQRKWRVRLTFGKLCAWRGKLASKSSWNRQPWYARRDTFGVDGYVCRFTLVFLLPLLTGKKCGICWFLVFPDRHIQYHSFSQWFPTPAFACSSRNSHHMMPSLPFPSPWQQIPGTDQFFDKVYIPYILRMARLAEQMDVELFSVGTELGKTLNNTRKWKEVIRRVKRVYSGPITYVGNHDVSFFHPTLFF